jgi:hypothetical protein
MHINIHRPRYVNIATAWPVRRGTRRKNPRASERVLSSPEAAERVIKRGRWGRRRRRERDSRSRLDGLSIAAGEVIGISDDDL